MVEICFFNLARRTFVGSRARLAITMWRVRLARGEQKHRGDSQGDSDVEIFFPPRRTGGRSM